MEAPLLQVEVGAEEWEGDCSAVKGWGDAWEVFVGESKKLWRIALPIVFNALCLYGLTSTTQIFVGHIGNLELSAVATSLSVVFMFSFGFLMGMGSALETLCGQAFGAGQVHMLGIYMQRSWIILTVSAVILCPLYVFATPLLKLLGQEDDIADLAGRFSVLIIPQLFATAVYFTTQKFLQSQSKVAALAWIGFLALALHVLMLWLFIHVLGWGVYGAAFAFDVSWWFATIVQVAYVVGWCRDGWTGLSWSAFRELWAFTRLSLASAVMLCLEVWYMMLLLVLAGHLHGAEIAVGSISICMNINGWELLFFIGINAAVSMNINGWEFLFFIGINAAVSVRVSNELGSGHPRATKHAVVVVVLTSLLIGLVCMAIILVSRNYFPVIFTSDEEMQHAVARVGYLLAVTMVLNSVQPVISGVAIGGGWQALVAYINLGCYYIFGLPLGAIFGYVLHWGVEGIWAGMICGTAAQTLVLLVIVWRTNWKGEAAQASARVRRWGGEENESLKA